MHQRSVVHLLTRLNGLSPLQRCVNERVAHLRVNLRCQVIHRHRLVQASSDRWMALRSIRFVRGTGLLSPCGLFPAWSRAKLRSSYRQPRRWTSYSSSNSNNNSPDLQDTLQQTVVRGSQSLCHSAAAAAAAAMDDDVPGLVAQIHGTPAQAVLYATGGGFQVTLLKVHP